MSQNHIVIQKITLECITVKSNKFYDVALVVENNTLKIETGYGAIGASPKKGVSGTFVVPDVRQSTGSVEFERGVAGLAYEANDILLSKLKKGYTGSSTMINTASALKKIYSHFPSVVAQKAAANSTATASNPPALNSFEVEVIGINWPQLKIAKVLDNFDYDVLGEVLAGQSTSHRIGDTILVTKTANGYEMV